MLYYGLRDEIVKGILETLRHSNSLDSIRQLKFHSLFIGNMFKYSIV